MEPMRSAPGVLCLTLLLAACGRTSFEPAPGGDAGNGGGPALAPPREAPRPASVVHAAAGEDLVVVGWSTEDAATAGVDFEIRVAPVGIDLGTVAGTSGASPLVLSGLPALTEQHVQLFQREAGGPWRATGSRLRFRTAPVIYVDPAAATTGPSVDPANPGNSLVFACLFASVNSRNVWVTEGDFVVDETPPNGSYLTVRGIGLHGGFAQGFAPLLRDPLTRPTRVRVAPGTSGVVSLITVVAPADGAGLPYGVVDGLELDGAGVAQEALDTSSEVEVRSTNARGCNRGFVLEKSTLNSPETALLSHCRAFENDLEGILVRGSSRADVFGCVAIDNLQEGCQFDPLRCPLGSTTAFTAKADVRDSTFSRNGSDGIDIDLRGPDDLADDVAPGGHFEVRIENVLCAENGSIGCLVDLDYEALDLWSSELVLERVEARANGTDGIRLDLDDGVGPNDATPTVALVRGCRASANRGDGFHVSSEVERVLVSFWACLAQANRGFGFGHSAGANGGNAVAVSSHCAAVGNAAGGFEPHAGGGLQVNAAAWLQPAAWPGGSAVAGADVLSGPNPFSVAADEITRVGGSAAAPVLLDPSSLSAGARVEWNDDGIERVVTAVTGTSIALDPAPAASPIALATFARGSVAEDLVPATGSALEAAGLAAPGDPQADLGPSGAGVPAPGCALVTAGLPPFVGHVERVGSEVRLSISGGSLDPATFNGRVRVVDEQGQDLTASATLVDGGAAILLTEPMEGWSPSQRIEVLGGLRDLEGTGALAPFALPVPVP